MSDTKPKSKFFKKPDWLKEQAQNKVNNESVPSNKKDATSMFARSTGTISDVLAEQRRKEALKAEKKAHKASMKEEEDAPSYKRRRTSEDGDYEGDRENNKKDSISPRRTTRAGTGSSPKSLAKLNETALLETLKKQSAAIVLSEGSEDEDDDHLAQQSSLATRSKAETARKPRAKQESQQEDEEAEAFPEIAARARERARQLEQERKKSASKAQESESLAPADTGPNPVINLLVISEIAGTEPLMVRRKWNQTFREVKHAWLKRQTNMTEAQKKQVYFTWRSKKTFDVATCKSLGIKLDYFGNAEIPTDQGTEKRNSHDQIVLIATTDEQLRLEKEKEEAEQKRKENAEEEPEPDPVPEKSSKLRLILRAQGHPDCKLAVTPDTTVERLVGAFRNTNNIPAQQRVTLSFDGEDLEPEMTMVDADVEDMNMIEVRIR